MKPPTKSGTQPGPSPRRKLIAATLVIAALGLLAACARPAPPPTATTVPRPQELVFYNWEDYMPQSVLDDFTAEYGVRVTYLTYQSMEEAVRNTRTGQVVYDVAVVEHDNISTLAADGLLAEINYGHVPNFR